MIVPTVGRIVWFTPNINKNKYSPHPLAAIICYIHDNRLVNLSVFHGDGENRGEEFVPLLQDDDSIPEGGFYCEWMPYQIKKAEEEKQA